MAADGIHEILVTDDSIRITEASPSRPTHPRRAAARTSLCPGASSGALHGEQLPPVRNALERVHAAVREADPRAKHQYLHGAGDQDLACLRESGDARADMDREARHRRAPALHLSGMQAGPDLDADLAYRIPGGAGAPDGPRGPIERDEESVPRRVDLAAVEPFQKAPDAGVMLVEHISPAAVTELVGQLRGPDDVGKEHRG